MPVVPSAVSGEVTVMAHVGRRLFPYLALALVGAAVAWSVTFSTRRPADFTFNNGTEVQSIDPARVTGTPEGRIITALFEGLYRPDPQTLEPLPGVALSHDVSSDKKVYTFHLRHDARWSDGTPLTAEDFRWSWQRMLHPETGSEYALLLGECVLKAKEYQRAIVAVGDRVEVELPDRRTESEPFPRGTILHGKVLTIDKPPQPAIAPDTLSDKKEEILDGWKQQWIYTVDLGGRRRRFGKELPAGDTRTERCQQILLDFDEVGIKAPDPYTFRVTLKNPTPYFIYLAEFFPLFPVQRACVEKFGYPDWTKAKNIVVNGPYLLEFRRLRDRIRLRKNPRYWGAKDVKTNVIDALAVESFSTGLNMFLDDMVDWTEQPPSALVPYLKGRDDYVAGPMLAISFYRVNVTHKPLDNVLLRRALNRVVDKQLICDKLLNAGQLPSRSIVPELPSGTFVPRGLVGYPRAQCGDFDVKEGQRLLAEAGYPGGRGLGRIELLYNNNEDQEKIAQYIGGCWERNLGLTISYRSLEWGTYLDTQHQMKYEIARSGWTGDYPDPNTYLGLFVSDCEQNETGWKNAKYDRLIQAAAREPDTRRRFEFFHQAEQILLDEAPVIPLYSAVAENMVKPYVRGFYVNTQDLHPLRDISVDAAARARYFQRGGRP